MPGVLAYRGAVAFALFLFSPVAAVFALVAFVLSRRFRVLFEGVSDALALGLLFIVGLGGIAVWVVIEITVLYPAQVQQELLGERIASPLLLREIYWQEALMDPMARWTYALDDEALARLTPRCKAAPGGGCWLASRTDYESFFSRASIEGGKLIIEDGLM